jgi:serine phosphatase RsbU (regulator of sigma subunit)/catechol 2,3-dioxygenase-like lactoylglutathione lyase family enzyme
MGDVTAPYGIDRSFLRLDAQDPYLILHFVMIFVSDQDRSLRFYVDQLGFRLVVDIQIGSGGRWIEVAPPDGSANIALALAGPGTDAHKLIGRDTNVYFLTEDVYAKYNAWTDRGVRFLSPPQKPPWGGIFARFEDIDGNSFGLAGFDELTSSVAAKRRVLAEKAEAERRSAQELEIAKQVQARLFPQIHPKVATLEYAGLCLPARQVGGDYFDFLDLGQERLGLVIGDVSGKGIAAALLMANLQANLRSQCTVAWEDPQRFLQSVNRLFYENTVESSYASLFFGEYDDTTQRLRYANCGHLSGLVLNGENQCRRLDSTGTLLGLFSEWDCKVGECKLSPGDTLALYTDGVTEAYNDDGDEFGEHSLIEKLREHGNLSCQSSLHAIADDVRRFSSREQYDDITLIIAKCQNRP